MELEAKAKLLEKQKSLQEHQAFVADKKAIIFDMMIDLAEKEYKIDIPKNSSPEQSTILKSKNTIQWCSPVICLGQTDRFIIEILKENP